MFESRVFLDPSGEALPYRFYKPSDYDPGCAYPLVLYLHGSGDGGTDNLKQLESFPSTLVSPDMEYRHPSFIVAPQLPQWTRWVDMDWRSVQKARAPQKPSRAIRLTLALMDQLVTRFSIDRNRIYVTGISRGGFGVWDILWRRPELFAAAIPVSGGGDLTKARLIRQVPVWAFHGAQDKNVPPQHSRAMVEALRKAGAQPQYTEYPDQGHEAWGKAYGQAGLFDWMFAQRREKR